MKTKKCCILLAVLLISAILVSCADKNAASDYSKSENWLSLPVAAEKDVDVFYLYPTTYAMQDKNDPEICAINDPSMVQKSKIAFAMQATAFETTGNIYAPYYRQVDAAYSLSLSLEEQDKIIGGIPAADATAAFDYYIKHYNQGRPFILAGHSQGSNVLLYLLSDYMKENPDVYSRMIAAYVIGYSVTDDYLAENPHLTFAEGPDDTGVIVSYNTQAAAIEGTNPVVLPGAKVINPITWTTEATPADAGQSLGSILLNADASVVLNADGTFKVFKDFADATVDTANGVLICSSVDVNKFAPGNATFGKGIYHSYDYPFYYFNIRQNAENRAEIFLSKQ